MNLGGSLTDGKIICISLSNISLCFVHIYYVFVEPFVTRKVRINKIPQLVLSGNFKAKVLIRPRI